MPKTQERARRHESEAKAPALRPPPGGLPGRLHQLQRGAGNRAVSRLIGDLPDRPARGRSASKADGGPAAPAGQVPDKEPEEIIEHEKGAGVFKEDGTPTGSLPGAAEPLVARGGLRMVPGDVRVDIHTPEVDDPTGRRRADTASAGTVTNTFSNPDTSPSAKPFGSESFKAGYKNASFTTTGGVVKVDFTLDIQCPWGTSSGGKTDVASGADPVVTKDNYKAIVSDLTPELKEKSWRAPRSKYWSEAICKRHEKFHSTDDKAWSEGAGKQVVVSYLNGKTINPATAAADVNTHLNAATKAMDTANFQFYTGGAGSYLSYAGEERAFGDGKQPYLDLATAVTTQGKLLQAAASLLGRFRSFIGW